MPLTMPSFFLLYHLRSGASDTTHHAAHSNIHNKDNNNPTTKSTKKYPKRLSAKYTGILLPVEIGELYDIRGSLTEAGIHVLREPPLMTFAKRRGQVTTISLKLLQSPVSKTEANLKIDDYLIEHISRAKRGTRHSCRMLYKTIYEKANINNNPKTSTEKQQKKRAPEKINKYLTHYQKEGFITRFTADADGITVYW